MVGRLVSPEMELCRRGYPVPDQGSPEFKPGSLINPGGPALLQVLEPGHMISTNYWPPEGLTPLSSPADEWPFYF